MKHRPTCSKCGYVTKSERDQCEDMFVFSLFGHCQTGGIQDSESGCPRALFEPHLHDLIREKVHVPAQSPLLNLLRKLKD